MLATPDPRHWWHLVFIQPVLGKVVCLFITETDNLEVALARAELNHARPAGCDLAATPFIATYVHADYLDLALCQQDMIYMPEPQGLVRKD